jgi:GT2 family glycosyltransferase
MKNEYPLVDIVVLNYNSREILSKSFPTLLTLDYPRINLIVVDNGSSDNSEKIIKNYLGKIDYLTFIKNHKNLGCPGGLNSALPYLKGKYSVFFNEDIFIIDKQWLKKLISILEDHADIGILGSLVVREDGNYEYLKTYFSKLFVLAGPTADTKPQGEIIDVPYIGLGMMVTRNNLLKDIGGFREKYFLYWDDVDYCMRVWLNGYRVAITTCTSLKHLHQGSIKKNVSRFKVAYLSRRNSLLFFFIFYPFKEILKHFLTVFPMRCFMFFVYLRKHYFIYAAALLLGSIAAFFHPIWVFRERWALRQKEAGKVINKLTSLTPDPYCYGKAGRILSNFYKGVFKNG